MYLLYVYVFITFLEISKNLLYKSSSQKKEKIVKIRTYSSHVNDYSMQILCFFMEVLAIYGYWREQVDFDIYIIIKLAEDPTTGSAYEAATCASFSNRL